jgi:hypothetical protein
MFEFNSDGYIVFSIKLMKLQGVGFDIAGK